MYAELTILVNGSLYDTFATEDVAKHDEMLKLWKEAWADESDPAEIYRDFHAHPMGVDCECAQYATDRRPDWTNRPTGDLYVWQVQLHGKWTVFAADMGEGALQLVTSDLAVAQAMKSMTEDQEFPVRLAHFTLSEVVETTR